MCDHAAQEPEAPTRVISGDFRQTRIVSPAAGAKMAWEALSPFRAAFVDKKLEGPDKDPITQRQREFARYEAGLHYEKLFWAANPRTASSVIGGGGSGCSGSHTPADAKIDAGDALIDLERKMGRADRQIITYFVGLEHTAAQSVSMALGSDYRLATMPRLREAFDALAGAINEIEAESRSKPRRNPLTPL